MSTANKLAGALSSLYPEEGKVKSLLGIEIVTLFDFFMVFVVMAAVASLILFLLSKKIAEADAWGKVTCLKIYFLLSLVATITPLKYPIDSAIP